MKILKYILGGGLVAALASTGFAGYTDWVNDYDGTSPNTMVLYKFNEASGTSAANSASGTSSLGVTPLTISSTNTTVGVAGKFDLAFQSNSPLSTSADSYARRGFGTSFALPEISVEMWFKPVSASPGPASGFSYILDNQFTTNNGFQIYFYSPTQFRVAVGNGTSKIYATTTTASWSTDTWTHLAFTYESGVGLNVFQDGENIATTASTDFGSLAAYTGFLDLANRVGSSYASQPGVYDNFRISNVAYDYMPVPEVSQSAAVAGALGLLTAYFIRRRKNL